MNVTLRPVRASGLMVCLSMSADPYAPPLNLRLDFVGLHLLQIKLPLCHQVFEHLVVLFSRLLPPNPLSPRLVVAILFVFIQSSIVRFLGGEALDWAVSLLRHGQYVCAGRRSGQIRHCERPKELRRI
jgi:hypothetical protein